MSDWKARLKQLAALPSTRSILDERLSIARGRVGRAGSPLDEAALSLEIAHIVLVEDQFADVGEVSSASAGLLPRDDSAEFWPSDLLALRSRLLGQGRFLLISRLKPWDHGETARNSNLDPLFRVRNRSADRFAARSLEIGPNDDVQDALDDLADLRQLGLNDSSLSAGHYFARFWSLLEVTDLVWSSAAKEDIATALSRSFEELASAIQSLSIARWYWLVGWEELPYAVVQLGSRLDRFMEHSVDDTLEENCFDPIAMISTAREYVERWRSERIAIFGDRTGIVEEAMILDMIERGLSVAPHSWSSPACWGAGLGAAK